MESEQPTNSPEFEEGYDDYLRRIVNHQYATVEEWTKWRKGIWAARRNHKHRDYKPNSKRQEE